MMETASRPPPAPPHTTQTSERLLIGTAATPSHPSRAFRALLRRAKLDHHAAAARIHDPSPPGVAGAKLDRARDTTRLRVDNDADVLEPIPHANIHARGRRRRARRQHHESEEESSHRPPPSIC